MTVKTRIRKGDTVVVISGEYKSLTPRRVLAVFPDKGTALVEGVNLARRHRKARSAEDPGGIQSIDRPIALSKLSLTTEDGQPTRVRMEIGDDGRKKRVAVRDGRVIG